MCTLEGNSLEPDEKSVPSETDGKRSKETGREVEKRFPSFQVGPGYYRIAREVRENSCCDEAFALRTTWIGGQKMPIA
jgi:hypothetical protein